ncbi:MAG: 30S ribosomal protein S11 [Myxococcota bacterium]
MARAKKGRKKGKTKLKKNISRGMAFIVSTFNNTIVTFTDLNGNVLSWSSAGIRFKGSRKSSPFAAQLTGEDAAYKAKEHGIQSVEVSLKGPGAGRDSALRSISAAGIKVTKIKDVTPIPHNGCRAAKRRRV